MTIEEIINKFISRFISRERYYSIVGTVSNVNESTRTCDVTPIEGAKIFDVRLQSILSSSVGIVAIPKDGSKVIVTFLNQNAGFVSKTEEVDKILIDTDLVKFNNGSEDLINISELTTKLNLLKTEVNSLITSYNTHVHITTATVSAGAPGIIAPTVSTGSPVSTFSKTDYNDDKIKH